VALIAPHCPRLNGALGLRRDEPRRNRARHWMGGTSWKGGGCCVDVLEGAIVRWRCLAPAPGGRLGALAFSRQLGCPRNRGIFSRQTVAELSRELAARRLARSSRRCRRTASPQKQGDIAAFALEAEKIQEATGRPVAAFFMVSTDPQVGVLKLETEELGLGGSSAYPDRDDGDRRQGYSLLGSSTRWSSNHKSSPLPLPSDTHRTIVCRFTLQFARDMVRSGPLPPAARCSTPSSGETHARPGSVTGQRGPPPPL
jgi:hypothetical protein